MKRLSRLVTAAVAVMFLLGALVAGLGYTVYGDRSHPPTPTQVVIDRGLAFDEIARQLAVSGVIGNVWTFRILARLRHDDVAVHAGEYRLPAHRTQDEVLRALVTGGAQVATWVSLPEGFTAAQIADRLQEAGVGAAAPFLRQFMHQTLVVDGTPTKNLEGFLFPNTYLVPLGGTPSQISGILTEQFFKQLPPDAAAQARRVHLSVPALVIVASLVEREAKRDRDRAKIAGVIYNRLRLNMPLQVDATIEYALPKHKTALSFGDLKIDSPYNTYTHPGLPPTPISNPGRPSLEAAVHPLKSDDLYYVYCGNGSHVFARTFAQHQANVARCLQ